MTSRIQNFLKSVLLEKYVQGETTTQESHKVDDFINQHPEIKEKYLKLEAQLELEAQIHAVTPPEGVLESIFDVFLDGGDFFIFEFLDEFLEFLDFL